jgi:hypothetical protein
MKTANKSIRSIIVSVCLFTVLVCATLNIHTDAKGKYVVYLKPREVSITCSGKNGYCLLDESGNEATQVEKKLTVEDNQVIEDMDFILRWFPLFTGQVYYPNGESVPQIAVDAWVHWKNLDQSGGAMPGWGQRFRLKTDIEGKFAGGQRVDGLVPFESNCEGIKSIGDPKNMKLVWLGASAWLEDGSMGAYATTKAIADGNSFDPLEIVLVKTGNATFLVVDANGKVFENADLRFHGGGPTSLGSLGHGQYRAKNLIPGVKYKINAYPQGYFPEFGGGITFAIEPGQEKDVGVIKLGLWGSEAVPGLIDNLRNPNSYTRKRAARLLARLGPEAVQAVPALIEVLRNDPKNTVRFNAAGAIGSIGPAAKEAVADLIWALKNDDGGGVKREAAIALIKIGDPVELGALQALREHGVSFLARALQGHPDSWIGPCRTLRISAAETLGKIGPVARTQIYWLERALRNDPEGEVRASVAKALGLINNPKALSVLRQALEDEEEDVRKAAAEAIKQIEVVE